MACCSAFTITLQLGDQDRMEKSLDKQLKCYDKPFNAQLGITTLWCSVSSAQRYGWANFTHSKCDPCKVLESRGFHLVHRSRSHNYGGGLVYWYVKNIVELPEAEEEPDQYVDWGPKKDGKKVKIDPVKAHEMVTKVAPLGEVAKAS